MSNKKCVIFSVFNFWNIFSTFPLLDEIWDIHFRYTNKQWSSSPKLYPHPNNNMSPILLTSNECQRACKFKLKNDNILKMCNHIEKIKMWYIKVPKICLIRRLIVEFFANKIKFLWIQSNNVYFDGRLTIKIIFRLKKTSTLWVFCNVH